MNPSGRTRPLASIARVIRSKNAGPFQQTIDLLFGSTGEYELVKDSGAVTLANVAAAYSIKAEDVVGIYFWDAALAVKISIRREVGAGAFGDHDCYGAQQHAPLLDIAIPVPD